MSRDEATRVFYEIVKANYICREDILRVDMPVDGIRAYMEAKCKRPLSEAKKKSMADEFYARTGIELYLL